MKPPVPKVPVPKARKPRGSREIPSQADRDDLEMAAWGVGEHGTKKDVERAYRYLWKILQSTIDYDGPTGGQDR